MKFTMQPAQLGSMGLMKLMKEYFFHEMITTLRMAVLMK